MNRNTTRHLFDLFVLLTILLGCISQPFNCIQAQSSQMTHLKYDSLISDSIRIDGKRGWQTDLNTLKVIYGEPDTFIRYKAADDFYEAPYSLIEYEFGQFRLLDSGKVQFSKLTLENNNHFIAYGTILLDKNTLMEDLQTSFPNTYLNKEHRIVEGRDFIALRFFTKKLPTDEQWVLLFEKNKLKSIQYFNGND